jgi:phosphatidylglycerophosphate synthase
MILTDYLDGFLASKLGQETPLGQYLDPVADKITILIALFLLYLKREYPLWLFLIILGREVFGSFFGVFLLTKRNIMGKPNLWGKTGVFVISISAMLYLINSPYKKSLDFIILAILIIGLLAYSIRYIRTILNIPKS